MPLCTSPKSPTEPHELAHPDARCGCGLPVEAPLEGQSGASRQVQCWPPSGGVPRAMASRSHSFAHRRRARSGRERKLCQLPPARISRLTAAARPTSPACPDPKQNKNTSAASNANYHPTARLDVARINEPSGFADTHRARVAATRHHCAAVGARNTVIAVQATETRRTRWTEPATTVHIRLSTTNTQLPVVAEWL